MGNGAVGTMFVDRKAGAGQTKTPVQNDSTNAT